MDSAFPSGGKDAGSIPTGNAFFFQNPVKRIYTIIRDRGEPTIKMRFNRIKTEKDIEKAVEEYGFLPFFRSVIPGLSLEEMADSSVWFPEKGEGVWEWKDPVIASTGCAYGKFFLAHPGFVSKELFMILASYRRDGYDIEGMINDGLLSHNEVHQTPDEDIHDDLRF